MLLEIASLAFAALSVGAVRKVKREGPAADAPPRPTPRGTAPAPELDSHGSWEPEAQPYSGALHPWTRPQPGGLDATTAAGAAVGGQLAAKAATEEVGGLGIGLGIISLPGKLASLFSGQKVIDPVTGAATALVGGVQAVGEGLAALGGDNFQEYTKARNAHVAGTKSILVNGGERVTVGGTGKGGPGWSELEDGAGDGGGGEDPLAAEVRASGFRSGRVLGRYRMPGRLRRPSIGVQAAAAHAALTAAAAPAGGAPVVPDQVKPAAATVKRGNRDTQQEEEESQ